ncbi:hypothetical protein D3C78_666400 [compost metagenome]
MAYVAAGPGDAAVAGQGRYADESGFQRFAGGVYRDGFQLDAQFGEILLRLAACHGAKILLQQHANPAFITLQIPGDSQPRTFGQFAQGTAGKPLRPFKQLLFVFWRRGQRR